MVKNADYAFNINDLQLPWFDICRVICYNTPMIKKAKSSENTKKMRNVIIFDLDQTVIDSSHRSPNNSDGTINLEKYFKSRNRTNIFRDKLLPLAKVFKQLQTDNNFIIVATARNIDHDDVDFLKIYEVIAFYVKANDKKYTIASINAMNSYRKKIEALVEKIKESNASKNSIKKVKDYISDTIDIIDINSQKRKQSKFVYRQVFWCLLERWPKFKWSKNSWWDLKRVKF